MRIRNFVDWRLHNDSGIANANVTILQQERSLTVWKLNAVVQINVGTHVCKATDSVELSRSIHIDSLACIIIQGKLIDSTN